MNAEAHVSGISRSTGPDLATLSSQLEEMVRRIDATDLNALAALHAAMKGFCVTADEATTLDCVAELQAKATRGMCLLEQMVLGEISDVQAGAAQVAETIADLRAILSGERRPELPASEPAAPPTSAGSVLQPSRPAVQAPIGADDLPLVQEFIGEVTEHIEAAETGLLQLEENNSNSDAIHSVFRGFHSIKGVAGFLNLVQISTLAHAAENLLDLTRKGKLTFDSAVADVILQSIDAMRKLVDLLRGVAQTGGVPGELAGLDELVSRLHDCAEGRGSSAPQQAPPRVASEATAAGTCGGESSQRHAATDSTVKVSTDRLDVLINMVGELVIAEAMVEQDMAGSAAQDRRVSRNLSHLGKITRELQDLSMSMRMVPIQGVFQKMARLVRDLARKSGKEIAFEVAGSETELDRNVVEAIGDPLVHMVRNAADHGIEPPEERIKAGKPREGRLTLKAYHQSGNIVIEITDDGRGLNRAKLIRKAIEAGLVQQGQDLSEREIFQLVFAPGLSTAEKVTEVSGRGVGMDVVLRNVQALRGQIDIASTEGKGSTFTIRLPLTLAVIDGLVVKVGPERYIIPITSIEQSIQPRVEQISTVQGRTEMCMVRNQLLPVLRLHRLFGVAPAHEGLHDGLLVIVQSMEKRCCLFVDTLLGQQQVVIKSLGSGLGQVDGISGGAILGDGNISLILDVPALVAAATNT